MPRTLKITIAIFLILFSTIALAQSTKVISIVNYEIQNAEVWEQALTLSTEFENVATASAVQKFFMRMRENDDIDNGFDYSFESVTPTTYLTNCGTGVAFNGVSLKNIFIRARSADAVLEIIYFH